MSEPDDQGQTDPPTGRNNRRVSPTPQADPSPEPQSEKNNGNGPAQNPDQVQILEPEPQNEGVNDKPEFKPSLRFLGRTKDTSAGYLGTAILFITYIVLMSLIHILTSFVAGGGSYGRMYIFGKGQAIKDQGFFEYFFWTIPKFGSQFIHDYIKGESCRTLYTAKDGSGLTSRQNDSTTKFLSDCPWTSASRADAIIFGFGGLFPFLFIIFQCFALWVGSCPAKLQRWSKGLRITWWVFNGLYGIWKLMIIINLSVTWALASSVILATMQKDVVHVHGMTLPSYAWTLTQTMHGCCGIYDYKSWTYNVTVGGYPKSCCNDAYFYCDGLTVITKEEVWLEGCLSHEVNYVHETMALTLILHLLDVYITYFGIINVLRYYEKKRHDMAVDKWNEEQDRGEEEEVAEADGHVEHA